jgi:hypothetical protein
MIDNLTATYTTLTQQLASSQSAGQRSETLQRLSDVRAEIEYWEARRDRSTVAKYTFTQGRPVR